MSVDEDEAGTRSPMTEKAILDIIVSYLALDENVVFEEYHSYEKHVI